MPTKVTAWQCSYGCGGEHGAYSLIAEHEKECLFNPSVKACFTCNKGDSCNFMEKKMNFGADLTDCAEWEPKKEKTDGN